MMEAILKMAAKPHSHCMVMKREADPKTQIPLCLCTTFTKIWAPILTRHP